MAFRQALQLAACGLAGGSAAVLFSAVAVGKPRAGGDAEPRVVEPPAWAGPARPRPGVWDPNWDRREPLSLVNLRKRNLESGEEELASRLDHYKAKATRHIFLIRHSQYHVDASLEKDRTLTPLGREQAELTGLRLASLGLKFNKIVHSSMTRAVETTDIISKHLPGVCKVSTDLLREGAPIEPDPPVSHWKPEAVVKTSPQRWSSSLGSSLHSVLLGSLSPPLPLTPAPAVAGHPFPDLGMASVPPPCSSFFPLPASSITKMEPGLRPPSGTTSTGQTPSSRRTVTRSSSATPMSSATSYAGEGS
uniref:Serine/threonine-protein phosphatase PGAM5, mitochondrial n=1 Tax=Equus caballus TaxID=9796 RepID=A0A9L0TKS4_HORSE